MPIVVNNTLNQIRSIAMGGDDRVEKARRLAELVCKLGGYRWVGIYDVCSERVTLIAWSGLEAPAHSSFSVDEGLTSVAIHEKRAVICSDVRTEGRYLTTFASTLSEIIVPAISPGGGHVIGTIEVESDRASAFSSRDQEVIAQCAESALPLWLLR
jgi:putative methionine-R-sulfoxide reductase with GAF domain